jgi:hypothetical protein
LIRPALRRRRTLHARAQLGRFHSDTIEIRAGWRGGLSLRRRLSSSSSSSSSPFQKQMFMEASKRISPGFSEQQVASFVLKGNLERAD